MGKTAKGAVWLDPYKTAPYEYYQYWINTDDSDVERFMALFTFLPMDEVRTIGKLKDADLNSAKAILAYETTLLAHGREEAMKAHHAAGSVFGARVVPNGIIPSSSIPRDVTTLDDISVPHSYLDMDILQEGIPAFKLFHMVGLATSGGAARRLIEQGGAYLNGQRIETFDSLITDNDMNNMELLLRSGKKRFHKIKIKR